MSGDVWICAYIACSRPEGEPHIEGCPYRAAQLAPSREGES